MMEWRAVWRGVRSAEKQLSALLESGVPTAAKELTTHTTVVRTLFVLSFVFPGPQAVFYLGAWILMPKQP